MRTHFEPWPAVESDAHLAVVLAVPGSAIRATPRAVAQYRDSLAQSGLVLHGWRARHGRAVTALLASVILPGRTVLFQFAPQSAFRVDSAEAAELLKFVWSAVGGDAMHYGQALAPPDEELQRAVLSAAGFRLLTPLVYMQRSILSAPGKRLDAAGARWRAYQLDSAEQFALTLQDSYVGSTDCPELSRARPIADILAAHRAAGPHDPDLWQLLELSGEPAGCVLASVSGAPTAGEIVYMGVRPAFRRRRLGQLLLQRAHELLRGRGVRSVALAVDARNRVARALYERLGFQAVATRDAWWRRGRANFDGDA